MRAGNGFDSLKFASKDSCTEAAKKTKPAFSAHSEVTRLFMTTGDAGDVSAERPRRIVVMELGRN